MKVIPVDCKYVAAEVASAYLLVHEGRGVFVECNTNHAIPHLKAAVVAAGLTAHDVDALIITHIHLDHAGGAGLFLREFPNAKLLAHPRAARHAIDPSKLILGATAVYGEAFMQKQYGEILSCDSSRVLVMDDGATWDWRGVVLDFKHHRGHAKHHFSCYEPITGTLFTGDAFGCTYPSVNRKRGKPVMIVSTSPTDFEGDYALQTVEWVREQVALGRVKFVAPTHFGLIAGAGVGDCADQLRDQLRFSIALAERIKREALAEDRVYEHIHDWFIQDQAARRVTLDANDLAAFDLDFRINAQGLVWAANSIA